MRQVLIEKYIEPSETTKTSDGIHLFFIERWKSKYGDLHSILCQPSVVIKFEDGQIRCQQWHKKDLIHRGNNLPAVIWYKQTQRTAEFYFIKGIGQDSVYF